MLSDEARGTLGIDIDNVISLTDPAIRGLFRDLWGVRLDQEQVVHYQYRRCGVTVEQERAALEVFRERTCTELEVVPGAIESLRLLQGRYRLVLVTSRNPVIMEKTRDWLRAREVPHDLLVFDEAKHRTGHDFDFFIEDNGDFAMSLAEAGISTFLFDYPWNRWVEPHPRIRRVPGWQEVLAELM
jgi:uncharacterized HAD superfamily protein